MNLNNTTLEKLRELINEETEYRSGQRIVEFFNEIGFNDSYGPGFPSRWMYTDEKLEQINNTPELEVCIKNVLAPIKFIGRFQELDSHISAFNEYLAFDKWRIVRSQDEIIFQKLDKVEINEAIEDNEAENEFLRGEFIDVNVSKLEFENAISEVLQHRIDEIEKCFSGNAPLAVILLAGSTLEGVFLGLAMKYPRRFNSARSSPKDGTGKVKEFRDWNLSGFIDVAKELGLIQHDTQKFSHSLRDFRNYIHPFKQMDVGFTPREHTARICLQVLKVAIYEINENINRIRT